MIVRLPSPRFLHTIIVKMRRDFAGDNHGIQEEQRRKRRILIAAMTRANAIAIGSFFLALNFGIGIVFSKRSLFSPSYIAGLVGLVAVFSFLLAKFQYFDARKNGARFIWKRNSARRLDLKNPDHRKFFDVVEKIALPDGWPGIVPYVIPDPSINGLSLIEPDGTACLAMTEGLLAELAEDEIEAVAAHEMAHIGRGDAFDLMIVCSLADFPERVWSILKIEDGEEGLSFHRISAWIMRFLSRSFDQEREILADAAAVAHGRDPAALARAILRAHIMNSLIGDSPRADAPLFFVPPGSGSEDDQAARQPAGTQPPLMTRIRRLADMAGLKGEDIVRQVWEVHARRKEAEDLGRARPIRPRRRMIWTSRSKEIVRGLCPRCRLPLADAGCEEGAVKICRGCGGSLVEHGDRLAVLTPTDKAFSGATRGQAGEFWTRFLRNPVTTKKIRSGVSLFPNCPYCGGRMTPRPFGYRYFVPVDKCPLCFRIWFDAGELEILRVLVEETKNAWVDSSLLKNGEP